MDFDTQVILVDLVSRPELNGTHGRIQSEWDGERYSVQTAENEHVRLRPQNIAFKNVADFVVYELMLADELVFFLHNAQGTHTALMMEGYERHHFLRFVAVLKQGRRVVVQENGFLHIYEADQLVGCLAPERVKNHQPEAPILATLCRVGEEFPIEGCVVAKSFVVCVGDERHHYVNRQPLYHLSCAHMLMFAEKVNFAAFLDNHHKLRTLQRHSYTAVPWFDPTLRALMYNQGFGAISVVSIQWRSDLLRILGQMIATTLRIQVFATYGLVEEDVAQTLVQRRVFAIGTEVLYVPTSKSSTKMIVHDNNALRDLATDTVRGKIGDVTTVVPVQLVRHTVLSFLVTQILLQKEMLLHGLLHHAELLQAHHEYALHVHNLLEQAAQLPNFAYYDAANDDAALLDPRFMDDVLADVHRFMLWMTNAEQLYLATQFILSCKDLLGHLEEDDDDLHKVCQINDHGQLVLWKDDDHNAVRVSEFCCDPFVSERLLIIGLSRDIDDQLPLYETILGRTRERIASARSKHSRGDDAAPPVRMRVKKKTSPISESRREVDDWDVLEAKRIGDQLIKDEEAEKTRRLVKEKERNTRRPKTTRRPSLVPPSVSDRGTENCMNSRGLTDEERAEQHEEIERTRKAERLAAAEAAMNAKKRMSLETDRMPSASSSSPSCESMLTPSPSSPSCESMLTPSPSSPPPPRVATDAAPDNPSNMEASTQTMRNELSHVVDENMKLRTTNESLGKHMERINRHWRGAEREVLNVLASQVEFYMQNPNMLHDHCINIDYLYTLPGARNIVQCHMACFGGRNHGETFARLAATFPRFVVDANRISMASNKCHKATL